MNRHRKVTTLLLVAFAAACGGDASGPGDGGSTQNPVPTISTLSQTKVFVGGEAFTLTVTGTNFISSSRVMVNGSARATTVLSGNAVQAVILVSDLATAGNLSIAVNNPAPGGGTSNSLTLEVATAAVAITVTSLSPNTAVAGTAGLTLTVNGTNFSTTSKVQWNGIKKTTTYQSSTQLTAVIPASDLTTAGNYAVTVTGPDGTVLVSNSMTFTVTPATSPGCTPVNYAILGVISKSLTSSDCLDSQGFYYDPYAITISGNAEGVQFDMTSSFDTYLEITDANGNLIGYNDDNTTSTNSTLRVFLHSGTYRLNASSSLTGVTGNYQISSALIGANVTNCDEVWTTKALIVTQNLNPGSDCRGSGPGGVPYYYDAYFVILKAGETITVTMTSGSIDSYIELYDANGRVAYDDDSAGGVNAKYTYTATANAVYGIYAGTYRAGEFGNYQITIQ